MWISDLSCWKEISLPRSSSCALLLHTLLTTLERTPDLTHWSIVEQNSEAMIGKRSYALISYVSKTVSPDKVQCLFHFVLPAAYSFQQPFNMISGSASYSLQLVGPWTCSPHSVISK